MSGILSLEERALVDELCDKYERSLRSGTAITIESLLCDIDVPLKPSLLRELLPLELELRAERGDQASRREYLERFPDEQSLVFAAFRTKGSDENRPVAKTRAARCAHCHPAAETTRGAEPLMVTCNECGNQYQSVESGEPSANPSLLDTSGRLELIEQVGQGGFGTVWKAFDCELERIVAVKVPRSHDMDANKVEKFLHEARATAQLRHPNIVAVHESGRIGDVVYIVSDFVDGVTLSEWAAGNSPNHYEVAQICATIAVALHHAHTQGIVHRDLKPANVLVDTDAQPHLTDFGLAHQETGELGELTVTSAGLVLGTPAYMPPEQAQGNAHSADRRSDVYSLGVILFQLLTGDLPFRGNARTLLHQVLNDDPPSPRKLDATIPKDLETICLKCLQKEPAKRFATAQELADELGRYLRSEPILTRPIGAVERSWRWCRRHPAIVSAFALGTALILTLLFAIVFTMRAKRDAENHRELAEQREETVRRTLHFVQRLFRTSDPLFGANEGWRQSGDLAQLSLHDVLSRAAPTVLKEVAQDDPLVAVEVLCTLGDVYRSVGEYDDAEEILRRARAIATDLKDQPAAQALAEYRWGWLCHDLGRYDEAQVCYERARQLRVEQFSEQSPEVAEVDFNLGWLLLDRQRTLQSMDKLQNALEVQRRFLPDDNQQVQNTALLLNVVLQAVGDTGAVEGITTLLKERPTELIGLVNSYQKAKLLRTAKKYDEALTAYTQIYDQVASLVTPGHPLRVFFEVDMAGLQRDRGDLDAAEGLMRNAIKSSGRLFDSNPKLVKPLMEFAKLRASRGDTVEATALYNRALAVIQGKDIELERHIRDALSALPQGIPQATGKSTIEKQPSVTAQ